MKSIPSIKDNWHWYVFFALLITIISPIFMMDYLITLDGPNHLYNSAAFNRLVTNDSFTQSFLEINPQITPNYASLLILSFLLIFVSGVTALKIFHLLYVVLFAMSFAYWNRGKVNINSIFLVFPLIFSYLFFSGFYNFILAIIIMFWILTFYEKSKYGIVKKTILLSILLVILYFAHSIVFVFTGVALAMFELTKWLTNKGSLPSLLKQLVVLLIAATPCIVFALVFMSARESEITYLSFSELISNLSFSKSIVARGIVGEIVKLIFTCFIVLVAVILFVTKVKKQITVSDYLLFTAISLLVLYFILPDSVGYASVFSVRIEYFWWIFLLAWIGRQKVDYAFLKYGLGVVTVAFVLVQNMGNMTFWKPLNSSTKHLLHANEVIPSESVVYPIFTSNVWEHYHLSNMLGVENNLFILENTGARQDYFPVQYKIPYEQYLDSMPGLNIPITNIQIDYVLKIGKNPTEIPRDIKIYNDVRSSGNLIYENGLIEVWKSNQAK